MHPNVPLRSQPPNSVRQPKRKHLEGNKNPSAHIRPKGSIFPEEGTEIKTRGSHALVTPGISAGRKKNLIPEGVALPGFNHPTYFRTEEIYLPQVGSLVH